MVIVIWLYVILICKWTTSRAAWRSRIQKNAWECFTCVAVNWHLIHRQSSWMSKWTHSHEMISISRFAHSGKQHDPCGPTHQIWWYFAPVFCGHGLVARIPIRSETGRPSARWMPSETHGEWFFSRTHGGGVAAWLNFHQRWSSQRNPSISPAGRKHFSLASGATQKNHRETIGILQKQPLDTLSPSARLQILGPHHVHARWGWVWQRPFSRFIRGRSWLLNAADSQALALHYLIPVLSVVSLLAFSTLIFGNKQIQIGGQTCPASKMGTFPGPTKGAGGKGFSKPFSAAKSGTTPAWHGRKPCKGICLTTQLVILCINSQ